MTTTQTWMVVVIVVAFLASILLALAETALTRMTRAKAQGMVDEGRRGAARLVLLVTHPERFLNVVLLVVLVCQLVQATLVGILASQLVGGWGVVVATVVNIVVVFVLAEAAPKTWAIEHPERAALVAAPPVWALAHFWPLRVLSRGLIGLANVILPGKGLKEGPFVSEEELLAIVDAAVEEDVIELEERHLISQIIEFGDTIVREVMVPRPDMVTVDAEFRVADVMEIVLLNGRSRIPVCGEGIDDVVGVVYAKDLMRAERDGRDHEPVGGFVREPHFVPETKRVATLLPEMQAEQFHMAIVVDEYGGTAGLVTMEDLIEELVGEIVDEFDREEPMVEPLPDGSCRVQARMAIDEVNDLLHLELPEGDWDTLGGLVFHLAGHVPAEGEVVECDGRLLVVERVQGRRIARIRIAANRDADTDHDERVGRGEARATSPDMGGDASGERPEEVGR
ncbi:hemolysin family protein [Rhabdothermincola salaria]|uniref:hemolysin family protein n=1 Tax=Rhabdothermincola salaria TaxID=2903142 RepID=UPI001E5A5B0D|nr:hemolysin family protein [Rhabdothermincola salaria]MCD9622376.1 hemolysin family protein [Rhabdothermincola salaria]